MNTCDQCRFWERDPDNAADALNECHRFRLPDARFDAGGIFLTRSDFGCVQFEPIPDTAPTSRDEILRDALEEAKGWIDPDEARLVNRDEARAAVAKIDTALTLLK